MKTTFVLLFLLFISNANAQDPKLFQYSWRLESIVTDTDTFVPSSNPDPNTGTYNIIVFSNQNSEFSFQFGVYGSVIAHDLVFFGNQSFDISFITLLLGESSPASGFLVDNFLFSDPSFTTIYNPFTYSFSYENDLIILEIENSLGSVVTFYDNLLSQEQFLEKSISIYPNPVDKVLHIDPANVGIQYLEVFDLQGRLIIKASEVQDNQIDVSALPQGIYILKIETDKGIHTEKVVKE